MTTMEINDLKINLAKWISSINITFDIILDKWFLIDDIEYKFCMAFSSDRVNILYRTPSIESNTYPILYAADYDEIIQHILSWNKLV
jgi:trehalose utilization protein